VDYLQFDFTGSQASAPSSWEFGAAYFVFIIAILLLQLRTRRRRASLIGLVLMPLIMLFVTLPLVTAELYSGILGPVLLAVGLIVGAGIGVAIGSMMDVKIDEKDGRMLLKGSLLAVVVWAVVIGIKIFGKDLLRGTGLVDMGLVTSALLMLTIGMMFGRRAMVYWRYWQMKKAMPTTIPPVK
jgi:hypothetical protein